MRYLAYSVTLLAFCLASLANLNWVGAAPQAKFFLRSDDRVVFLGDSITALNTCTWPQGSTDPNYTFCTDIVSWMSTRLPAFRTAFYDAGVPGDTAQGDIWPRGGPSELTVPPHQTMDERMQMVEGLNPTVITINLGMNDGEYVDCNPADHDGNSALYASFTSGIKHIVTSLLAWSTNNRMPLRLVVMSPSYFDDSRRTKTGWKFSWGPPVDDYNQTLLAFGSWERSYVDSLHHPSVTFIDLNAPMAQATSKLGPDQSLTQEGIHPTEQGYEVIAAAILYAWNAQSVSTLGDKVEGASRSWPLYNGGTAYGISGCLRAIAGFKAVVSSPQPNSGSVQTYNQDIVAWDNKVVEIVRTRFIMDYSAIMRGGKLSPVVSSQY